MLVTERMRPLRGAGPHRPPGRPALPLGLSAASARGDSANDLFPLALDPNVHIQEVKAATCDVRPGRRPRGPALLELVDEYRRRAGIERATALRRSRPASSYGDEAQPARRASSPTPRSASAARRARSRARSGTTCPTTRTGFTGMSYDNTGALGANTWRHVAFIEQRPLGEDAAPIAGRGGLSWRGRRIAPRRRLRWLMSSDVCKHCTARRVPRGLPDGRAVPHRVRHGGGAAGRLQRLRLLRRRRARSA